MQELSLLGDLLVIFVIGVAVVALLQRVGVPTIAGFIVAGTVVGPRVLGVVENPHEVELLAEIGVALLLFGIGLELQLGRLRYLWRPVVIGGALQVGITSAVVFTIARAMGLPVGSSAFMGFIIAVSSTAIVLRGLGARGELDAPHGRLTLGILVFQDLCVVPMILAIPLLAAGGQATGSIVATMGTAFGILAGVLVAAWFVVPRLLHVIAQTRQRDLFVLTVFLVCIGTAWVVSRSGASLALGAFLAGLVVAGSEYRHQAMSDLIPFREVLTSLFFVSVGMLLDPAVLFTHPGPILGLLAAILVGKFTIVALTAAVMRLPLRVCVLAGASLAQVGEFSFVLMRAASETPLIGPTLSDQLLPAVILSMLITPIFIAVGPKLAAGAVKLEPIMRRLGVRVADEALARAEGWDNHVIIAGFGITGQELARSLRACNVPYVILDLNPDNVRWASESGEPIFFGDVTSPEVLHHLNAEHAREIVLVVNDPRAAERAVEAIRRVAPKAHVLVRARYVADTERLLKAGADEVVPAELEAAVEVSARVLGRYSVEPDRALAQLARIRGRTKEREPLVAFDDDPSDGTADN